MFVSCECCVLSGRDFCVGLIIRPKGVLPSVVCKTECEGESSITRSTWSTRGCCAMVNIYISDAHCIGLNCNN